MRSRLSFVWCAAIAFAALTGCAKHDTQTAQSTESDSLIASNPVEAPSGNLKPQVPFEAAPPAEAPPPAPAPRPSRSPRRTPAHPHHASANDAETPADEPSNTPSAASPAPAPAQAPGLNIEWGSYLHVTFDTAISSETAQAGDSWTGTLKDPVYAKDQVALPAGSVVHGTVKDAKAAAKGDRASLTLTVDAVDVGGRSWPVPATADPIVAGSTRLRNVGAVAGGAGVGAILGRAIGGSKGTLIGGLLGGAAAGGAVARSKGYQVVVKAGTTMTFTVAGDAVVRP